MEFPLRPLADISEGCSFTSISLSREVRLCVCRNKNSVQETAISATNSADLRRKTQDKKVQGKWLRQLLEITTKRVRKSDGFFFFVASSNRF